MSQTLRPYQSRALDASRAALAGGARRVLLVAPTGSGKTTVASAIMQGAIAKGRRVLFLAHRRELIDQCVARLAEHDITAGVILAGRQPFPHRAVQVASVQTLARRELPPADLVIVDECFPAGTLVDGRPIETLRVGDLVGSWNHERGAIEQRRVVRLWSSRPASLVTVYVDGEPITSTATHPFYVLGRGYVAARELNPGDPLLGRRTDEAEDLRRVRHHLHPKVVELTDDAALLADLQEGASRREGEERQGDVHDLWGRGHPSRQERSPAGAHGTGLLLGTMQDVVPLTARISDGGKHESASRLAPHAREESHEPPRVARAHECDPEGDGTSAAGRRWERARANGPAESALRGAGLADGGGDSDRRAEVGRDAPHLLPRGHRELGGADRGGGGRGEPRRVVQPGGGSPQGRSVAVARVDRVEVHQPAGDGGFGRLCPGGRVYNIEVEGNHNYFAGGVLVHNCHHARARSYQRAVSAAPVVLGLTATPWRTDGRGLGELFEQVVVVARPRELIDQGYLCPVTGFSYAAPELDGVHTVGGDYDEDEAAEAMSYLGGDIVQRWLDHRPGRTVLFACTVEHSLRLAGSFRTAGVVAEHLDGTTPLPERAAILARLAAGTTEVVCNCAVLTEGWDCPELRCVVLARPTKSVGLYLQMAGRGLRPTDGKAVARIHDHAGNALRHGLVDQDRDYALDGDTRKSAESIPTKTCPKCFAIFAPAPKCPACGHVFVAVANPREIEEVAGQEVAFGDIAPRRIYVPEGKARPLFLALAAEGAEKGYKPGWAAVQFKARLGFWPRAAWREAAATAHTRTRAVNATMRLLGGVDAARSAWLGARAHEPEPE